MDVLFIFHKLTRGNKSDVADSLVWFYFVGGELLSVLQTIIFTKENFIADPAIEDYNEKKTTKYKQTEFNTLVDLLRDNNEWFEETYKQFAGYIDMIYIFDTVKVNKPHKDKLLSPEKEGSKNLSSVSVSK